DAAEGTSAKATPAPHSTYRDTERKTLTLPVPHTMLIADESDQNSASCHANAPGGPMTACIVGWAHTPFGRLDAETVESLTVRVANEALQDAGIAAADVDEILLGHFNAGFSAQDFTASLVLQASPDLRFKRATRVENACATG